ncbi:hypothetical protein LXL04_007582 [Taraxacum kok-saghyz]
MSKRRRKVDVTGIFRSPSRIMLFLTDCGVPKAYEHTRSFENSYSPENQRTSKPLTFSKNRLRGAKKRSNPNPVPKTNFRKNKLCIYADFQILFLCIYADFQLLFQKRSNTFKYLSLNNTYIMGFGTKIRKKRTKKSCIYETKFK